MSEVRDQPISAAGFADIGARLDGGFGCFEDGPFLYVVLSMTTHRVDVLLRGDTETFTDAITRQPDAVRVAVNGQLFGPFSLNALGAAGIVDPANVHGNGQIRADGRQQLENSTEGEGYFYFGRNREADAYEVKCGNPPNSIHEGMGGLGALIMTRVDGTPLRIGIGNRYSTGRDENERPDFLDESDPRWLECTQKNSTHFESLAAGGSDASYCAIGASRARKVLIFVMAKAAPGNGLEILRDKLLDAGFDCACLTDGGASTTFAVDRDFALRPVDRRNNTIEAGFVGVRSTVRRARVRVSMVKIEILDPATEIGDEGAWLVSPSVNGVEFGQPTRLAVTWDSELVLGLSTTVELREGELLDVTLRLDNLAPASISGVDPPALPPFRETLGIHSNPPWGEGNWSQGVGGFYRLHYAIELLA